jgi:hypothetical protein
MQRPFPKGSGPKARVFLGKTTENYFFAAHKNGQNESNGSQNDRKKERPFHLKRPLFFGEARFVNYLSIPTCESA